VKAMVYKDFTPPAHLAPFITCIWCLECPHSQSIQDSVLPDAFTELIAHYAVQGSGEIVPSPHGTVFAGQIRHALNLEFEGGLGMVGVRFKAQGAFCLFRENIRSTTDAITPLGSMAPQLVQEFEDIVLARKPVEVRVARLWEFLQKRLCIGQMDAEVLNILSALDGHQERLEVSTAPRYSRLSQRQMERRFQGVVGLSMKEYNRILRFKQSVRLLRNAEAHPLVDVALASGYHDQSHFNHEFKAIVGLAPSAYLR